MTNTTAPAITLEKKFRFQADKTTKLEIAKRIFPDFAGSSDKIFAYARDPENTNVDAKRAYAKAVGEAALIVPVTIGVPNAANISTDDIQLLLNSTAEYRAWEIVKKARNENAELPAQLIFESVQDFFPEESAETADDLTEEELAKVPLIVKQFIAATCGGNRTTATFYQLLLEGKRSEVAKFYMGSPDKVEKFQSNIKIGLGKFAENTADSIDKDICAKLIALRENMTKRLYSKFKDSLAAKEELENLDLGAL